MAPQHTSKLEVIYKELNHRITSGHWEVGDKLPTEQILADEFKCGIGTISKAMARLTQNNLVERRARAGTVVINNVALQKNPTSIPDLDAYAFIYPGEQHESIWKIANGFQQCAAEQGRRTLMLGSPIDVKKEVEIIKHLSDLKVKGAALYPIAQTPQDYIEYLNAIIESGHPIVLICNLPNSSCSSVTADGLHAGFTTTNFLIKQGVKRIGFLANYAQSTSVRDHYLGYRQALNLANIAEDKACTRLIHSMNPVPSAPFREPSEIAKKYLAETKGKVEAVVCGADFLGISLVHAAKEMGLRIPEDLKVISVTNNTTAETEEDQPTSYRIDLKEQGRQAFKILDATVKGELNEPIEEQIKGEIIVRSST